MIIASNSSPAAQTDQGVYIGRQITINGSNVNYWYGIPYAQQPTGGLRWMPPQSLPMSNGTQFAYTNNVCPQGSSSEPPFTEACLVLNVYAPENATNLPVYVYIHGGGFSGGIAISYNAIPLVGTSMRHAVPIVVVSINYRLGLLGFLADQALYDEKSGISNRSTTGNYGILDQMMALDWINKNIDGFGGNPNEITIGGESAGGISVSILLTSPLVPDGTFQRTIIESGGLWPNLISTFEDAINHTGKVLRTATNCTTAQCLRNLTVKQILSVQTTIGSKDIVGVGITPVIDNYVLNDLVENNYARGNFKKVPMLIGSTTNETSLWTCGHFHDSATIAQVQAVFASLYNTTVINKILDIYGPISIYSNPLTYLNLVYSDSWAHCGSRRIAARFSAHNTSSYLYTYSHFVPAIRPCIGVLHTAELAMIFLQYVSIFFPNYNLTAEEQQLSTNMMLYWTNFIRTSNPNFDGSPANWDAYSIDADNDFVFNIHSQMRLHYYNATCSGLWDQYAVTNSSLA
ncbi:unnamed protein product [Adineta ricciae]|uniref:Carboxylic ester hydrolase n=2 Tax=Adineta ricciae TaxID=249248 RepID=A0A815VLT3_ADIRI|nr:unnamed protein product [Adineta ricciae]